MDILFQSVRGWTGYVKEKCAEPTNIVHCYSLQDHVIVAVFAEDDSPLIGLRNLVMPLRASNIHYNDLLHVVIVGNAEYLKSKCIILQSFFNAIR